MWSVIGATSDAAADFAILSPNRANGRRTGDKRGERTRSLHRVRRAVSRTAAHGARIESGTCDFIAPWDNVGRFRSWLRVESK